MKLRFLMLSLLAVAALTACVTMPTMPPPGERDPEDGVFSNVMLQPQAPLPVTRRQFNASFNVVVESPIPEDLVMSRASGKVTVKYGNFRSAVDQTLKDTFKPNFKAVSSSPAATNAGLELIVTHIRDNPGEQGFDWRASFVEGGKPVTELWGTMLPSKAIAKGSTIYTWKRDTKDVTVELTNKQITDLATYIATTLLQDEKMKPFWSKYQ